jgi:hypothetical protein
MFKPHYRVKFDWEFCMNYIEKKSWFFGTWHPIKENSNIKWFDTHGLARDYIKKINNG